MDPDVVVLAWVLNDSEDEDAAEARRARDWAEEERRADTSRRARPRRARSSASATPGSRDARAAAGRRLPLDARGRLRRLGRRAAGAPAMGGMCRAHGVPFVVVIFPAVRNRSTRAIRSRSCMQGGAGGGEAGATVVDLLPHYRTVDWRLLVVDGTANEHPNEIAHHIAAQAIVKALAEVVPRSAASRASMSRASLALLLALGLASGCPRGPPSAGPRDDRGHPSPPRGRPAAERAVLLRFGVDSLLHHPSRYFQPPFLFPTPTRCGNRAAGRGGTARGSVSPRPGRSAGGGLHLGEDRHAGPAPRSAPGSC